MNTPRISQAGRRLPAFLRRTCALAATLFAFAFAPLHAASVAMEEVGVGIRPHAETDTNAYCDRLIAAGVKWVRMSPEWAGIETSQGVYSSTQLDKLDGIVNRLRAGGVNIVWVLFGTPTWASSNASAGYPASSRYKPSNWVYWENYVTYIATRYNTKISHWEVWNEPDHFGFWKNSVADYATLLQKARAKLKAVNSANVVLLGGLATIDGINTNPDGSYADRFGLGTFFDNLLGISGVGGWFDVVNYHSYGDFDRHVRRHAGMMAVINKYSLNKPVWITEAGFSTGGNADLESLKALFVDQNHLGNLRFGNIDRWFVYNFNNNPSASPSEANFGLMDGDLNPLPAWWSYQALDGAETDFARQVAYPTLSQNLHTLYYYPASSGDGSFVGYVSGPPAARVIPAGKYLYLRLNDTWLYDSNNTIDSKVYVDVTYLDSGTGTFTLQYDGSSIYTNAPVVTRGNTHLWKTHTFTLTDARFANRQNNQADLRILAGTGGELRVSKVAVRKIYNPASIRLKTVPVAKLIRYSPDSNSTNQGYNPVATIGGVECRSITGNNKYIFLRVSDALIREGDTSVSIKIRFWDGSGGSDQKISIQYGSSLSGGAKNIDIQKNGTNQWRTETVDITDAKFVNQQSYYADFRIGNGNDNSAEYVHSVYVTVNN